MSFPPRNVVPRLSGLPRHSSSSVSGTPSARTPRKNRLEDAEGEAAIRVAIRIRPLLSHEVGHKDGVKVSGQCVVLSDEKGQDRHYAADVVLDSRPCTVPPRQDDNSSSATQAEVFDCVGKPLVARVLEGFNACLLAYGHTGSGKTYTVLGEHWAQERRQSAAEEQRALDEPAHSTVGVLPRALLSVFSALQEDSESDLTKTCFATFYEVYNERVQDLLVSTPSMSRSVESDDRRLRQKRRPDVHFHPRFGAFIDGLAEVPCNKLEEALHIIAAGTQARTTAVTGLNDRSSRSHAVFTLRIEQSPSSSSSLMMVDLAGREQERSTNAASNSERFKELTLINRSLFHLAHCVRTLAAEGPERAGLNGSGTGQGHHFRNSKLTMILGHALAGNSHTALIGTLSPSRSSHEDSLATLRFCESVKQVRTRPVKDSGKREDAVQFLEDEVRRLSTELNRAQTGRKVVEMELTEAQLMCQYYRNTVDGLQQKVEVDTKSPALSFRSSTDSNMAPETHERMSAHIMKGTSLRKRVTSPLKLPIQHVRPEQREQQGPDDGFRGHSDVGDGGDPFEATGDVAASKARRAPTFLQDNEQPDGIASASTTTTCADPVPAGQIPPPNEVGVPTADFSASTTASEGSTDTPRLINSTIGSINTRNVPSLLMSDGQSLTVDDELRRAMGQWLEAAETSVDDSPGQGHRTALIETIQKLHSKLSGHPCSDEMPPPLEVPRTPQQKHVAMLPAGSQVGSPPTVVRTMSSAYAAVSGPARSSFPVTKARIVQMHGKPTELTAKDIVTQVVRQSSGPPPRILQTVSIPCTPPPAQVWTPGMGTFHAGGLSLLKGGDTCGNTEEVNLGDSPRGLQRRRDSSSPTTLVAWEDRGVPPATACTRHSSEQSRTSRSAARTPRNALGSPGAGRRSKRDPCLTCSSFHQAKLCLSAQGLSTIEIDAEGRPTASPGAAGRAPFNNMVPPQHTVLRAESMSASYNVVRTESNPPQSPPSVRLPRGPPPGIATRRTMGSPPMVNRTLTTDGVSRGASPKQVTRRSLGSPPIISRTVATEGLCAGASPMEVKRRAMGSPSVLTRALVPEGVSSGGSPLRTASSQPATETLCRVPSAPLLAAALEAGAVEMAKPEMVLGAAALDTPHNPSKPPAVQVQPPGSTPCSSCRQPTAATPCSSCRGTGTVVLDSFENATPEVPWVYGGYPNHTPRTQSWAVRTPRSVVTRQISCEANRASTPSVERATARAAMIGTPSATPSVAVTSVIPASPRVSPEVRIRLMRGERVLTPGRRNAAHEVLHWTMDLVNASQRVEQLS